MLLFKVLGLKELYVGLFRNIPFGKILLSL